MGDGMRRPLMLSEERLDQQVARGTRAAYPNQPWQNKAVVDDKFTDAGRA